MIAFLINCVVAFTAYSIGVRIGALSTLARLNEATKEMQSIFDDLQKQLNQWTEDDL